MERFYETNTLIYLSNALIIKRISLLLNFLKGVRIDQNLSLWVVLTNAIAEQTSAIGFVKWQMQGDTK